MNFTDALEMANWYNQREPKDIGVAAMSRALMARIRELEAALKQVACDCNGEAGCKSYALYYKLCPALETSVSRCNCGWPRTTDGEHGDSCPVNREGEHE